MSAGDQVQCRRHLLILHGNYVVQDTDIDIEKS